MYATRSDKPLDPTTGAILAALRAIAAKHNAS
jgi:hypothetical protein